MKNMIFLSGLPRTGSTLLTSILCENSKFYYDGNSALCQLMWDTYVSCETTAKEQLLASKKIDVQQDLISSIPDIYYKNIDKSLIIDKCRSWTLPANIDLIQRYISKDFKMIVMTRPIIDIVKSFVYIRKMNGYNNPEIGLLDKGSEPIMRSLDGLKYAKENNKGQFLFVEYDDLVNTPEKTIDEIYQFCGIKKFKHNFTNIKNNSPENDNVYELVGFHEIRSKLEKRKINVKITKTLERKALSLTY
jgi:sulfotransferase